MCIRDSNTTMETEFWRIAPPGVSVHTARIAGGRHGTPEELRGMESASKQAAADVAMVEPAEIYRKVKEITTPKAEAVFVACTQLRALEVLDALERDLGKPVYS